MRAYRQAKTIDWIEQRFNAAPSPEIEEEVLRARALVTSSIFVAVLLLGWRLAGSLGSTGTLADPATAVATTAITATFVVLRISSSVYWPGIWFGCWTIVAFGAQLLLNVDASFALFAPLILAPAIFGLVVSARAGSLSTACVCAMFLAAALINLGSGSPDATQNILLGAICTAFCGGLVSYFSSYREQETRKLIILSEGFRNAAYRDSLTNAFNRRAYNERMLSLQRRMHQSGRPSLLVIDVDKFKSINDTYGHAVGDKVLKFIVQRIENVLEDGQTLYRIGGDEFAILFEDEAGFEVLGDVAAN
ncbi:MAG: GGDEF domain-containing protein, partial [Pseudomonadota bacterium]